MFFFFSQYCLLTAYFQDPMGICNSNSDNVSNELYIQKGPKSDNDLLHFESSLSDVKSKPDTWHTEKWTFVGLPVTHLKGEGSYEDCKMHCPFRGLYGKNSQGECTITGLALNHYYTTTEGRG